MGGQADFGETLTWEEMKKVTKYIKEHGILQFIQILKKYANHKNTGDLQWGYEIESHVVSTKEPQPKLYSDFDLNLRKLDQLNGPLKYTHVTIEGGAWMIELIPKDPLSISMPISKVLEFMKNQMEEVRNIVLNENLHILSIPTYPKLGVGDFYVKPSLKKPKSEDPNLEEKKENKITKTHHLDDLTISWHPRYTIVIKHIHERHGS